MGIMPRIDAIDEAVIDGSPVVVYKAFLNEWAGVTHWWMPYLECKLRGDIPIDREGAIVDITVHSRGTPKFSAKMAKIVEAKSVEAEYSGDLVGTAKLTFEPTDGKTKMQYRLNVRTNRILFSLVSPFMDIGKIHLDVMRKGFEALNSYLSKK